MFIKKNDTIICLILLYIALCAFPAVAEASPYYAGYEWNRNAEYTTSTNPGPDGEGNNVWSYEWFTGSDYLNTNLFTQVASWGPRWEHGPINISGWDQNTNYSSGWNTGFETTLIRWTNPAGDDTLIDVSGSLNMWWGGSEWQVAGFFAYPVDVQLIMGYYDTSESQATLLIDQFIDSSTDSSYGESFTGDVTCNPFGDCPKYVMPLDYQVDMDAGDSIFWTAIPLQQINKNRWITLNDGMDMSISVAPEPVSSTLFFAGAATLGFRRFRKKRSTL